MPEWYLVIVVLGALSAAGALWAPLFAALPLLALALGALLVEAGLGAATAPLGGEPASRLRRLKLRTLTVLLLLLQSLARLRGRLGGGLTPWRRWRARGFALPRPRSCTIWSDQWEFPEGRLRALEAALRSNGVPVVRGSDYDRWDIEARGGVLGAVRIRMAVEEHGAGRQLERLRWWPRCAPLVLLFSLLFVVLAAGAAFDRAWPAAGLLGLVGTALAARSFHQCAVAMAAVRGSLEHRRGRARAALRAVQLAERTRA
jgi:hypothetical protein